MTPRDKFLNTLTDETLEPGLAAWDAALREVTEDPEIIHDAIVNGSSDIPELMARYREIGECLARIMVTDDMREKDNLRLQVAMNIESIALPYLEQRIRDRAGDILEEK